MTVHHSTAARSAPATFRDWLPADLTGICGIPRRVPARFTLVSPDDERRSAVFITDGWAFSHRLLADGGRQIVDFHLPGEFAGIGQIFLSDALLTIETVTPALVGRLPAERALRFLNETPMATKHILEWIARSEARITEHLVDVGRRGTEARAARLLLELHERLMRSGRAGADGFDCPLNQYLMADALGMTAVHLNRVFRRLRETGLVSIRDHHVRFRDRHALAASIGALPER